MISPKLSQILFRAAGLFFLFYAYSEWEFVYYAVHTELRVTTTLSAIIETLLALICLLPLRFKYFLLPHAVTSILSSLYFFLPGGLVDLIEKPGVAVFVANRPKLFLFAQLIGGLLLILELILRSLLPQLQPALGEVEPSPRARRLFRWAAYAVAIAAIGELRRGWELDGLRAFVMPFNVPWAFCLGYFAWHLIKTESWLRRYLWIPVLYFGIASLYAGLRPDYFLLTAAVLLVIERLDGRGVPR